jgi:hypothetical protein
MTRHRIDVGCVLHGDKYDWIYVERLHNMVSRNIGLPVDFHVWTEHDRSVPPHMIKHCLTDWQGIAGPKKSWWYKMQMFDPGHFAGDLLYFDLDVVICRDIGWITQNTPQKFWTIRDFRYLQRPGYNRMNSSVMWWNVQTFAWIWQQFQTVTPEAAARQYPGDQDFLQATIGPDHCRFLPDSAVQSWRWSAWEGGMDFNRRQSRAPGTGAHIAPTTSILVFHGNPKPHQVRDAQIQSWWI